MIYSCRVMFNMFWSATCNGLHTIKYSHTTHHHLINIQICLYKTEIFFYRGDDLCVYYLNVKSLSTSFLDIVLVGIFKRKIDV